MTAKSGNNQSPNQRRDSCILFFVKHLDTGAVKTRLGSELGEKKSRELYLCFVQDMLGTLNKTGHPCRVHITPPDTEPQFRKWLGDQYEYAAQAQGDLGERMERAFQQAFEDGFERAVLIGSDIPDISPYTMKEALRALKANDAVIGPAKDGGYYLIGFSTQSFLPAVFSGIDWSTSRVFKQTMDVFFEAEYTVHTLPKWHDVDTVEDLRAFAKRNQAGDFMDSCTMQMIKKIKIKL